MMMVKITDDKLVVVMMMMAAVGMMYGSCDNGDGSSLWW